METKVDKVLGLLREKDAGGGASGGITSAQASSIAKQVALPKNSSWTTTVGGYTIMHTSGGVSIYGSGASAALSNGSVAISANNAVSAFYYNENEGTTALLEINSSGVTVSHNDGSADGVLAVKGATVTANGSAITQISSSFSGASLGISELSGGVKYVCQSALTALSIGSAAAGCNAAFFFTVASGAVVTLPGSLGSRFYGEYPNSAGVSYCLAINGDMAVCAAAVSAGV